jgi:hypothetical protein
MKKTIVELFDVFKNENDDVMDINLDGLTNESRRLTAELFWDCPLHEFLNTLTSNNAEIIFDDEEIADEVIGTLTQRFSWADSQQNTIVVELHNELDEVLEKLIYRGYTIEYIKSKEVRAKEETFSRN